MLPRYGRFLVVLVALMLATPMASGVLISARDSGLPAGAEELAPAPVWPRQLDDWLNLSQRIDAYLRDHFGLRHEMIRAWSVVSHLWLRSGNESAQVGYDGWLFYRSDNLVRQSAGLLVRQSRVIETADIIRSTHANLAARGIKFIFASPPNSATIYPDKLPEWGRNSGRQTEYGMLLEALAARGVPAVDLRPPLRAARAGGAVFYPHDTHWSPRGYVAAYNAIVASTGHGEMQHDLNVVLSPPHQRYGGDLARMLGIQNDVTQEVQELVLPTPKTEWLDAQPRPTFLSTPEQPDGPTILVLGDSFTWARFPPLVTAKGRRFGWTRHARCSFEWKWIEELHPDEVWWMPTERFLLCNPGSRPAGMPTTSLPAK